MFKYLKHHICHYLRSLGLMAGYLHTREDEWSDSAQTYELEFHKNNKFRQTVEFDKESADIFSSFGFTASEFAGKTILDVGAGSKLRGRYFSDSRLVVIEPLADKFLMEIPWCDLHTASSLYSFPAEHYISQLSESADFIFSINALDHCYNFEAVIKNLSAYAKRGALMFLSYDCHWSPSLGHPLVLSDRTCREVFLGQGLIVKRFQEGFNHEYEKLRGRNGYDGSSNCLNYWLIKP